MARWRSAGRSDALRKSRSAEKLFFDPATTRAAIVTCGGLCPGLNDVIRSVVSELIRGYGVTSVLGIRGGYRGLDPSRGKPPLDLTDDLVEDIHRDGGTILGTSRGPVDDSVAVDFLIDRKVNILFTVGGDGTQRGGNALYQEARKRGHALAVVGIPKTIDNDVRYVSRTFGFGTAVDEAVRVINSAHTEAHSVDNGVSRREAHGPPRRIHRRRRHRGQPGCEFLPRARAAVRSRRPAGGLGETPRTEGPRRHRGGGGRRPAPAREKR